MLLLNLILSTFQVSTSTSMTQSRWFTATEPCIRNGSVLETTQNLRFGTCAIRCTKHKECREFTYDYDSAHCSLGSETVNNTSNGSYCVYRVSVSQSANVIQNESKHEERTVTCDTADGWYLNTDRNTCIKPFLTAVSRQEAQDDCQTRGAQLPIIASKESKEIYVKLMTGNDPSWHISTDGIWVNAMIAAGSQQYRWSDGTDVTADEWSPNEPYSYNECTQFWRLYYLIDDVPCDSSREYVCEKNV